MLNVRLNLKSVVHKDDEHRRLEDRGNPMDAINKYHSLLKRLMRQHGGYRRDGLQDWMNLFWGSSRMVIKTGTTRCSNSSKMSFRHQKE